MVQWGWLQKLCNFGVISLTMFSMSFLIIWVICILCACYSSAYCRRIEFIFQLYISGTMVNCDQSFKYTVTDFESCRNFWSNVDIIFVSLLFRQIQGIDFLYNFQTLPLTFICRPQTLPLICQIIPTFYISH